MGDSRIRNIFEYFEYMIIGEKVTQNRPHYNLQHVFADVNLKLDFLWTPLTEYGNQEVFTLKIIFFL
jgi:hypothetical protein